MAAATGTLLSGMSEAWGELPGGPRLRSRRPPRCRQPLRDVFFDFDKAVIREDQKAALDDNVAWLKSNSQVKITVQGHCNQRGTNEYNLGLGECRAKAMTDYLVTAGIAADRTTKVSYGKDRPFILGHDETAWKWNRRGQFVITGSCAAIRTPAV